MTLALRGLADPRERTAVRLHPHQRAVVPGNAVNAALAIARGALAGVLSDAGDADAAQLAAHQATCRLPATEFCITGDIQRATEAQLITSGILPRTQHVDVGELLFFQDVLQTELRRIDGKLAGGAIHQSFSRKECNRRGYPAIGPGWTEVSDHRAGVIRIVLEPIGTGKKRRRTSRLQTASEWKRRIGTHVDGNPG